MYRWCVEEQLSSYAIHKRLTLQGVPTRTHNRRGWVQSTVMEILRDSVYKPMVLVSYKPIRTIVLTGLIVVVMHFLQTG